MRCLLPAVVVGGDRARADVGARADLDVAHVGEVRHLRALADLGVLGLDERADVRVGGETRARPERDERTDGGAVADPDLAGHGLAHDRAARRTIVSTSRVSGPMTEPAPIDGATLEDRAGEQADVGLELDRRVDVGARRVDHRDAVAHPARR